MTAPDKPTINVPPGMVALTTYGQIQFETHQAIMEMRSFTEQQGIRPIWTNIPGSLVDRARNQAVRTFLTANPPLQWLLFVDGDAVFKPDALCQLLTIAYGNPNAPIDAIGAYCTLRGEPYLPTIDTGTGTWESILPGQGPMQVMRTGSAFILMKRHCFERVEGPWYGTRNPMRPIDALTEVDNYAHTKFDGKNPLADIPEWQALVKCARDEGSTAAPHDIGTFVGEDSNWCDRMRFAGLNIYVHTDIQVDHVDRTIRSASDHRDYMKKSEGLMRRLVGMLR